MGFFTKAKEKNDNYIYKNTGYYKDILDREFKRENYAKELSEKAFQKNTRFLSKEAKQASRERLDYLLKYDEDSFDYINNWHDAEYDRTPDKAEYYRNVAKKLYKNCEGVYEQSAHLSDFFEQAMEYLSGAAIIAARLAYAIDEEGFDSPRVKELEIIFNGLLKKYRNKRVLFIEDINNFYSAIVGTEEIDQNGYSRRNIILMQNFNAKDVYRMDSLDDFDAERAMMIWYGENVNATDMKYYIDAVTRKFGRAPITNGVRLSVARLRTIQEINSTKRKLRAKKNGETFGGRPIDESAEEIEANLKELVDRLSEIESKIAESGVDDDLEPATLPNFYTE